MRGATNEIDPLTRIPSPDVMMGRTVHERVLAAIRTAVIDGTLPADLHLRQTDIARAMGVSVTPVREALRDLAGEGLVRLDAHHGAVVRGIDLSEFVEIRLLLQTLWPILARFAAERITEPEIAALWDIQRQIEADPPSYLRLNADFHGRIAAAARAPRTTEMLGSLNVAVTRVLGLALGSTAPHRLHEGIHEHLSILAALEAHDPEAAVAAVLDHTVPTWDSVEKAIRQAEGER